MAMLTDSDYAELRIMMRTDPQSKQLYINSGLRKSEWKGFMQGAEDWFEANRASMKTAADTEAGVVLGNPLAKKCIRAWLQWKFGGE